MAYSTSPGSEAEDGSGANSPFTTALVSAGKTPGLPIESTLKDVRLAVHRQTVGRQVPWEVSSLIQPFSFFPGSAAAAPRQDKSAAVPSEDKSAATPGQDQSASAPGLDQFAAARGQEKSADAWREELKSKPPQQALEIALREDRVVVYKVVLQIYPQAYFSVQLRALLDRRIEMWDWFDAVGFDLVEGYAAFLNLYPNSDLAVTARRLQLRARLRTLAASTSQGALGLSTGTGQPQVQTVIKEVPVVKTVIKEVPVVKEVVKTVIQRVPEIKTVTKVVQAPCRCSTPERGPGIRITPGLPRGGFGGGGFGGGGRSGGQHSPR